MAIKNIIFPEKHTRIYTDLKEITLNKHVAINVTVKFLPTKYPFTDTWKKMWIQYSTEHKRNNGIL